MSRTHMANVADIRELDVCAIQRAIHTMIDGHNPSAKGAAFDFVYLLVELSLGKVMRSLTTFLGPSYAILYQTTPGMNIKKLFHNYLFDIGSTAFRPPFSRPVIVQTTLANYLWSTVPQSDCDQDTDS